MRRIVRADYFVIIFHIQLYFQQIFLNSAIYNFQKIIVSAFAYFPSSKLSLKLALDLFIFVNLIQNQSFRFFNFHSFKYFCIQTLGVLHSQIYIQKKQLGRMNSYQSTIDSQSDSGDGKYVETKKQPLQLRRSSKRIKPSKIFKIQIPSSKIQIQEPIIQCSNFSQQVRDYASEIIGYVSNTQTSSIINENYMEWQTDINVYMRDILVGWLIEVSTGLNLKMESLHLAVLLVDKFCYSRNILKRKYQVLGGACLYIAAKYEEITTPRLRKYVEIADGAYTANQLLIMESQILLSLNFNIQEKSTLTFHDIKCQQYCIPKQVQSLGYFLLEMCLIQYEFCRKRPTYLSLAVIYTAMKLKKKKVSKIKVFASENNLDEDIFTTYLQYAYKLYSLKHLPKFSPARKRYTKIFTAQGVLR